jgi:hypothetical protein
MGDKRKIAELTLNNSGIGMRNKTGNKDKKKDKREKQEKGKKQDSGLVQQIEDEGHRATYSDGQRFSFCV